jgi:hemerythrin-like metal-binding protein
MKIFWHDAFKCGHLIIDKQHHQLFDIGNEVINAILANKPKSDVELILGEFIDHIMNHFNTEEAILAEMNHPLSKEHQEVHRSLVAKAMNIQELYHIDQAIISDIVGFITYDVVTEHIIKEDLKFAFMPASGQTLWSKNKGIVVQDI